MKHMRQKHTSVWSPAAWRRWDPARRADLVDLKVDGGSDDLDEGDEVGELALQHALPDPSRVLRTTTPILEVTLIEKEERCIWVKKSLTACLVRAVSTEGRRYVPKGYIATCPTSTCAVEAAVPIAAQPPAETRLPKTTAQRLPKMLRVLPTRRPERKPPTASTIL